MTTVDHYALDRARNWARWMERTARNLANDTNCLAFWARKIETQRDFLTEMEAALDDAEKALTDALEQLKQARQHYKTLPVA